jgi:hypothetical protein
MRSLLDPPPRSALARFDLSFGQRFLVTVDTEEEFDWTKPLTREGHGLDHVPQLERFQGLCEDEGVVPVYLVDWPIAQSPLAAEILRAPVAAGKAEVGVQLHPWVNPPFEEKVTAHNSFAGNLPRELERAKFRQLRDAIEANFGAAPAIYRAGRYGVGPNSAEMLAEGGIAVDTSVRANFAYTAGEGPDFRRHPLIPYWLDEAKSLLELPLTTVYWGMLRRQGASLYPKLSGRPMLRSALARSGLLERIPLTPEGTTVDEAIRGIDIALDDGLPVLVLSFHSPSLTAGHTPYVRDKDGVEALYDWWRRVFAYLELRQVKPTTTAEILAAVRR